MLWFVAAASWALTVQAKYLGRKRRARQLAKQGQWHQIYLNTINEFDYLHSRGMDMGLFRTFAVPKISRLAAGTKEFTTDPAGRYDATDMLIREGLGNAPDTERHKLACARTNQIHGRYSSRIQNQQMLYALGCMIIQPVELINQWGARRLTKYEEEAMVRVHNQYGLGLGLTNMPETMEGWREYQSKHELKYFQYDPANKQLADAVFPYLVQKWPAPIRGLVVKSFVVLAGPSLTQVIGLTQDPKYSVSTLHRAVVHGVLLLRKVFVRMFVPPADGWRTRVEAGPTPAEGQLLFCRYHPYAPARLTDGYQIETLGPKTCPVLDREELLTTWSKGKYAPDD